MARIHRGPIQRAMVLESPDPTLDALLRADGMEVVRLPSLPARAELIARLQEHRTQVIFKRSRAPIERDLIVACPDLLAVQLCCIGDDSVDKQACADHGVLVFNDPISNGRSVVELVVAHLIALSRRLYETNAACNDGIWEKDNDERYEILGKRLGILGLGNIGRAVARVASALGMEIRFFDTRQVSVELGRELGWTATDSVEQLFRTSDCITVHLSAQDVFGTSNELLLNDALLQQIGAERPEDSPRIFLNLSRGFLHSAEALCAAVDSRRIRRAAVDVYPDEPRGKEPWHNPYHDYPRIAVTPHIGASTLEAQPRIARRVSETFHSFSHLGALRDCVFHPRLNLQLSADTAQGHVLLAVTHSTTRGTKRAIDDAIYRAGASNLASAHHDFADLGVAYDLALLDRDLSPDQIDSLITAATEITGEPAAIRSVRQIPA